MLSFKDCVQFAEARDIVRFKGQHVRCDIRKFNLFGESEITVTTGSEGRSVGLFRYSELVKNLVKRDFKVRYRNSVLGFLWALFNPLAMMVILTLVFSVLLKSSIENFPVFLLLGLLPWRFFTIGTSSAMWSIVGNPGLVTKVYFPREILVLSSNLANFIGIILEFAALFPLLLFLGVKVTWLVFLLPLVLAVEFLLVFGLSLALASLNIFYRDIGQLWEIALQIGFFLTPIFYSATLIPKRYLQVYSLNPMMRVVELARKLLYYESLPTLEDAAVTFGAALLFFAVGFIVFRVFEPRFAEEV